ncbi:MAG TPA: hypothetical protein PLQ67_07320 [Burkholderiaceae bacterium]|nr:hypothetical protein [Burkholderiaceae bacterium]
MADAAWMHSGCDRCWSSQAPQAWEAVSSLPIESFLIDEPHVIVSIRACPACAQRYLQVTTETIDWQGGEDPVDRTIIPIDDGEHAQLITSKPLDARVIEAVGSAKRSLRYHWPKGQSPSHYWGVGLRVGPHD